MGNNAIKSAYGCKMLGEKLVMAAKTRGKQHQDQIQSPTKTLDS